MLQDQEVERVLVVTAHPDDVDFGAGATIAKWTSSGVEVHYCICTDGDAGGFDPDVPREQISGIRQAEQRAAAVALGVSESNVTFLGYKDGYLTADLDVRRDISRVVRSVRPQRLVCQSPEWNYDRIAASHPDHRAAGEAALCSVYPDARNPFAHPTLLHDENLTDWSVSEVWVMGHSQANHYEDVTATFDEKLQALMAHQSQTSHRNDIGDFVRRWMEANAFNANLGAGRLAEAFRVMNTA